MNADVTEIIRKKWKWEKDIIEEAHIVNWNPHGLRWLIRNGEKVLQQELYVRIQYTELVWKHGNFTHTDIDYIWLDVPIESEE